MKKIKKINAAKRAKIILEQDETLVSHGGGLLIDEFIHRLGLAHMIDSTVKVKERERGYRESEAILALAVSMITGGVCLDDHKLKDLADRINTCMDSGFYDKEIVAECERLNIGFSITADQTGPLMRAVNAINKEEWIQIEDNVWFSELWYKPSGWQREYRFLVRREELPDKKQMSLLDVTAYRYHVIVTNRAESVNELIPFHLGRATMENFIKETKYGLSLDRFPCQEFHANWAYLNRDAGLQYRQLDQETGIAEHV